MKNRKYNQWLLELLGKFLLKDLNESDELFEQLKQKQNRIRSLFFYDQQASKSRDFVLFIEKSETENEWIDTISLIFQESHFTPIHSLTSDFAPLIQPIYEYIIQKASLNSMQEEWVADFICQEFFQLASRVIAYELKWFKLAQSEESSESAVYQNFIEQFNSLTFYQNFLLKYPALARLIAIKTGQIINCLTQFFEYWEFDKEALLAKGMIEKEAIIAKIDFGMSDPHGGGQSVAIMAFQSGEKLVYKPRSLHNDLAFYGFLDWVNEKAQSEVSKILPVLSFETHGWVKFAPKKDFQNVKEIKNYFFRLGSLNALFHFLCATDMHPSNVIQQGEFPIPIDFECLLSPMHHYAETDFYSYQTAGTCAYTNLTPYWKISRNRQNSWYSYGILDSERMKILPDAIVSGVGTGNFKVQLSHQLSEYANHLQYDCKTISPQEYLADFLSGFEAVYKIFLENQEELLSENSPLKRFKEVESRVVLRKTKDYSDTLFYLLAPDNLQSVHHQWVASERAVSHNPLGSQHVELLKYERIALLNRDVPAFYGKANQCHLHDDKGNLYKNVLSETPYGQMLGRIREASETDLNWQKSMLSASYKMIEVSNIGIKKATPDWASTNIEQDLKLAVEEIAHDLMRLAIRTEDGATWLDILPVNPKSVDANIIAASPNMYDGSAGIALFLLQFGLDFQQEKAVVLATEAVRFSLHQFEQQFKYYGSQNVRFSAFEGLLSGIYASAVCGRATENGNLMAQTERLLLSLSASNFSNQPVDYTGGLAGCMVAILKIAQYFPASQGKLHQLAEVLGELLIEKSDKFPIERNGIAHGHSGIAMAFLHLWRATQHEKWREMAWLHLNLDIEYVRTVLNTPHNELLQSTFWWCNGITGIGMVLLDFLEDNALEDVGELIAQIANKVAESQLLTQHHVCCGESGKILFLQVASERLGKEKWHEVAKESAHQLLSGYRKTGKWHHHSLWEGNQIPSFMSGSSGIAFTLLQVISAEKSFLPLIFE